MRPVSDNGYRLFLHVGMHGKRLLQLLVLVDKKEEKERKRSA